MPPAPRWPDRLAKHRAFRWSAIALVSVGGLLLALMVADVLVDAPLRRYMERHINAALTGYTVRVGDVDLHLLTLSLDLEKVTIVQDAHPDPPVAFLPSVRASVQWKEILSAHLVGDVVFEQPSLHIDLAQLSKESTDDVPLHERGWQDALAAIYPLKINALEVNDASLVYQDVGDDRPLRASHIHFHADNIRNVHSERGTYPSPVHLAGTVFDRGFAVVDGRADFLADPSPAIRARLHVTDVDLEYFEPVARRMQLLVKGGWLGAWGEFEYASDVHRLDLENVVIDQARIDYMHTEETAEAEQRIHHAAARTAQRIAADPTSSVRVRQLDVHNSEFGYRNQATSPSYRLYLTGSDLELRNLESTARNGPATASLVGRFMGDAPLKAHATFREGASPDFDVKVAVDAGQLTRLNDLLRAYAKLDVVGGTFSVYTEVRVKNGAITGYVKPLFHDVNVYDKRQDKGKSLVKKAYEAIAGGLASLLQNRTHGETATVTSISGPVQNVKADTGEIIGGLIRNAFFKAILPGFQERVKAWRQDRERDRDKGRTRSKTRRS